MKSNFWPFPITSAAAESASAAEDRPMGDTDSGVLGAGALEADFEV